MTKWSHALGAVLLGGLAAFAAPAHADPDYDRCIQSATSNIAFDGCGGEYLERADAALNAAWKQALGGAKGRTRLSLLGEQRKWIAFKDASCKFYASGDFGREGTVISYPACRGEVIEARTKELQAIAKALAQR